MTLREWRKKKRMTQEALALEIGVEQSLLSRWERRLVAPSIGHAANILRVAGGKVTLADLSRVKR